MSISNGAALRKLLPRGAIKEISKALGLTPAATGRAIGRANPTHPAVQAALKKVRECGSVEATKELSNVIKQLDS